MGALAAAGVAGQAHLHPPSGLQGFQDCPDFYLPHKCSACEAEAEGSTSGRFETGRSGQCSQSHSCRLKECLCPSLSVSLHVFPKQAGKSFKGWAHLDLEILWFPMRCGACFGAHDTSHYLQSSGSGPVLLGRAMHGGTVWPVGCSAWSCKSCHTRVVRVPQKSEAEPSQGRLSSPMRP